MANVQPQPFTYKTGSELAFKQANPSTDFTVKLSDLQKQIQAKIDADKAAQEAAQQAEIEREAIEASQIMDPTSNEAQPMSQPVYNAPSYSGSLAQWLSSLRNCESGGDYSINTGNGYYGAYQFTIETWDHWDTGYARADLAPPAVQDATIIQNTLSTSGLSTQNPGCMTSQGLSNYPPNG